jgi:hypothetical protein
VTVSFATRFAGFAAGDVVKVLGTLPPIMANNSEPFEGTEPANVVEVDGQAWMRLSAPRERPTVAKRITRDDVMRLFDWDVSQFTAAISLNFPEGQRALKWNSMEGVPKESYLTYSASDVEQWRDRVVLMGLRP